TSSAGSTAGRSGSTPRCPGNDGGTPMRRVGLVLLAIGLAGFLLGPARAAAYETPDGAVGAAASPQDRHAREGWETARWLLAGTAVVGVVFVLLAGETASEGR